MRAGLSGFGPFSRTQQGSPRESGEAQHVTIRAEEHVTARPEECGLGGGGGGVGGGGGEGAPATAKRVKGTHGISFSRRSSPPVAVACTKPAGEADAYLIAGDGMHSHEAEVHRKEVSQSPVFPACRGLAKVAAVQQEMAAPLRRDDRLNQDVAFRHGAGPAKCHVLMVSMGSQDEDAEAKVDSAASLVSCAHTDKDQTFEPDNAGMCSQSF
jgi:hypothetical protein